MTGRVLTAGGTVVDPVAERSGPLATTAEGAMAALPDRAAVRELRRGA